MTVETPAPPQVPTPETSDASLDALIDKLPEQLWDKLFARWQAHAEQAAELRSAMPWRWQSGQPTPNLNKALSCLQGELPKVTKDKEGKVTWEKKDGSGEGSYPYQYADLAAVTEAISPLLGKYGLSYICQVARDPADKRHLILTATLGHESGEERASDWYLGPSDWAAQKLGGRITYGRRYLLGCLTGVVAEHDDDGADDRRSHDYQSAGAAFQQASRHRPDRNGDKRQRQDDSGQTDKVAQAIANAVLRVGADPDKRPADLEGFEKQAAGKSKLDAPVANPFGDGLVKLRDVLREVRNRMGHRLQPEHSQDADESAAAAAGAADAETAWATNFLERLRDTAEDGLPALKREIASAVRDRTISPEVASDLSSQVDAWGRRLQELRGQEGIAG